MSMPWPMVPLGEVLKRVDRFESRDELTEYIFAGTYSFARGIFVSERKVGATFALPKIQRIRAGDFVYCKIMAWEGAFGLVPKEADNCVMSGAFVVYKPKQDRLNPKFLDYFFKVPLTWQTIGRQSTGTNVRRQSLHPTQFENAQIPLPPLSEQQRIVARIEELAAKIEEAKGLRQKAIEEAEALIKSIRSSCLSDAQERYGCEALGNLISMSSGEGLVSSQLSDSFEYPVYGGGGFVGYYSRYLFEEPKIAIGRVGARCGCVFVTEPKAWITDNALYLTKISDRLDERYLVYALSNADLRQEANQAAQPVVSQKKINPIVISLPPLSDQRRIVAYLDDLQAKVDAVKQLQADTAKELDAMLPSVLDKAFKGEM